jgi:hypothetical protein
MPERGGKEGIISAENHLDVFMGSGELFLLSLASNKGGGG